MATLDPWVMREAKAVVASKLDGPNAPETYAALTQGQKEAYRKRFLQALYTDTTLNKFCKDKRVAYYKSLVELCRPLMGRLAQSSEQGRANANALINADPASLESSELRKRLRGLKGLKGYLDGLPAPKPTKVQEEVEEEVDGSLTEMARAVLRESKLTDLDYARKLGRRIMRYQGAVKKGTPAANKRAGYLWRELRNSLAGWLSSTPEAAKLIEKFQGETTDRDLSAFAKQGFAPVKGGRTWVDNQWTQDIPKPLVEWQSEWALYIPKNDGNDPITKAPGGAYTPAEVADWLYTTNLGRVYLAPFLSNYPSESHAAVAASILEPYPAPAGVEDPPPLFALDSSENLGNGTAPDAGAIGTSPRVPSFDLLVRGSDYFTGPLSQRVTRLETDLATYVNQQKTLREKGQPQDFWGSIKFPALQSALNFLQKKTENESDSWSEVSQKTSARDPWIPLHILSAFASYKCQFPWSEWGEFFTHPAGVTPARAKWWTTFRARGSTYTPLERSPGEVLNEISEGGDVPLTAYDPLAPSTEGTFLSKETAPEWPNPKTLGGRAGVFKPFRLEVVKLGPQGAYAYRTYDWFKHRVENGQTIETLIRLYKLPTESEEEFLAALKEENGVGPLAVESGAAVYKDAIKDFINNEGNTLVGGEVAVPRVIPLACLQVDGSGGNIPPLDGPKRFGRGATATVNQYAVGGPGSARWGSGTTIYGYKYGDEKIEKLRLGISPMARLFIFYLNNDYSPFSLNKGLGDIMFKQNVLYKALTGESFPGGGAASPPGTTQEYKRDGTLNDGYLADGDYFTARREYSKYVKAYQRLYTSAWAGAQYINVEKEAAADLVEWQQAQTEAYTGTVNPALIPQTGTVKERVFVKPAQEEWQDDEPEEYRIGQGFLSRITRRLSNGSRLSSIERAMGIPEPNIALINIGKEVKRSIQQQRIDLFENITTKAFLSWMDEEGTMGSLRTEYQKSLTAAYNRAWSGYFTPARVEDGIQLLESKGGAAFSPANKYNIRALYGPRLDLEKVNPATNRPYATAASDTLARWNPKAVRRQGQEKSLYPYQSDAVLRLVDKNGGLLAFDVGVGKTITSLAAVGMLKQQGKATRPVFLVPKSIKLKWWKDMKENYPDWRVGVFGMKIGYPSSGSDLDAPKKKEYRTYVKLLVGRNASSADIDFAEKAAMLIVTGQASVRDAIIKAWGKLDSAVAKRVGKAKLDAQNELMTPRWVKEEASERIVKLQKFRDGYYDCLLLDEYDFKQIAINRIEAGKHLLQGSPTFGFIFAKAFGSPRGYLGKPSRLVQYRIMVAAAYLGLGSASYKAPAYAGGAVSTFSVGGQRGPLSGVLEEYLAAMYRMKTNNGSTALWPWMPMVVGDQEPYYASARAYLDEQLPELAGAGGELFETLGDLFFERNLTLPRSFYEEETLEFYTELLNADKDAPGEPSGARLVFVEENEESVAKALTTRSYDSVTEDAMDNEVKKAAKKEYRPSGKSGADRLTKAIREYVVASSGDQVSYPDFQEFWPNIMRGGPARYPDGTFLPGAYQLLPISYDFTLPQGFEALPVIQKTATGWGFVQPAIVQTATNVAELVATVINEDPSAFNLPGPVMVEEEFAKEYPSPFSGKNLKTPPSRLDAARKLSALTKPYLSQSSPLEDPTITWEDLKVDSLIVDEAHKFKGLFEPGSRGGQVAYLTSGQSSTQAWLMEYLTHTVKKRGGQVTLLTATPAKQSPVDFYNIVQLLGARNLGPHENLYNLFNINTPEQFISRFVCIQERVIVNSNYEARRGIAATMFGPFGNLLTEFTQIFKRYSDRKTVADAPYLRGDTAATSRWLDYSPAQRAKQESAGGRVLWSNGEWEAEGDLLTTIGPSLDEVFKGGLPRARLRVWRGDDSGDFRILGWTSIPLENGTFKNGVMVTPTFGSPAGSGGYDKQPWTIFTNTKVPVPVVSKPVIRMGDEQRALYEKYQRALGLMMVNATNSVTIDMDGEPEVIERRVIFATLSRLALHPELQAYSARFDLDALEDEPDEDSDSDDVDTEAEEALKEQNLTAAAGQTFSDALICSYREGIDPNPWLKGAQGKTLKSLQAFTGISDKGGLEGDGGKFGWNGKAEKLNPEYLDLRTLYRSTLRGEAEAQATESVEGEVTPIDAWAAKDSGAGVSAGEKTPLTNRELLRRLRTILNPALKNAERLEALKGVGGDWLKGVALWNEATGKPFITKSGNGVTSPTIKISAAAAVDDPEVLRLNANAPRTLGISDTIVAQMLHDTTNPWMGSVTCGTVVFVNNLLYQGMQLMTLCRFYALALAALYELGAYKKSLKGDVPDGRTLLAILRWYGIGVRSSEEAAFECPFTSRALLTLTFPEANIENLGESNTYAGDAEKGPSPLCKIIRGVQNRVHSAAFGDNGGTYSTPSTYEEGSAAALDRGGPGKFYEGSRYGEATGGDPGMWEWLSIYNGSSDAAPKRWKEIGVNAPSLKSIYADAWITMGKKCALFNAPLSPGIYREELAQKFNGEYMEVTNSKGEPVTKCLRDPEYDVVIANQVAYEGIDLQTRTCRVINADTPFTPADLTQRNGRAIRNGNLYEKAEIQVVLALDTVDYYRIQAIERKRGWLDSALDEGKASYELTNDEVELLDLATKAVLPDQREAVKASVAARLDAIASESRERSLAPILNQLTIAATKQRTININSASDTSVYEGSIESNQKAKTAALRQSARPTGGCG